MADFASNVKNIWLVAIRKWPKLQLGRYWKDGYSYFAVTLKDSDKPIGQAGLMKSEINWLV